MSDKYAVAYEGQALHGTVALRPVIYVGEDGYLWRRDVQSDSRTSLVEEDLGWLALTGHLTMLEKPERLTNYDEGCVVFHKEVLELAGAIPDGPNGPHKLPSYSSRPDCVYICSLPQAEALCEEVGILLRNRLVDEWQVLATATKVQLAWAGLQCFRRISKLQYQMITFIAAAESLGDLTRIEAAYWALVGDVYGETYEQFVRDVNDVVYGVTR